MALTPLLDEQQIGRLLEAGIESGESFTSGRHLLLRGIDRAYAATLPKVDNERGQLESDLRELARLPYLVSKSGDVQTPLVRYLENAYGQLSPNAQAGTFMAVRDEVRDRTSGWMGSIGELLAALAETIPSGPEDPALLKDARIDLSGYDMDRAPAANWALALHVAAQMQGVDALLKAASGRSPAPRLAAAIAHEGWAPAARAAAGILLDLEVGPGAPAILWQRLVEMSRAATESALLDFVVYDAETFVPRLPLDQQLEAFRAGKAQVLVVFGEAGSGKSSLMVHWAKRLLEEGDAVVLLRGAVLGEGDLLARVRSTLEVEDDDWPGQLDAAAADAERHVMVIVDGVNDLAEADSAKGLFARLTQAIDHLPREVRVVLTVLEPTWRRVSRGPWITRAAYFRPGDGTGVGVALPGFDDGELELAWTRHRQKHDIPTPLTELPPGLRRHLRNPSMMKLVAETFAGEFVPDDESQTALKLYYEYFLHTTERGKGEPDREFLRRLSMAIYEKLQSPIPVAMLRELRTFDDYLKDQPDSVYRRMLDASVLRQILLPQEVQTDAVEYTVTRFGAWVLAGTLRSKLGSRKDAVLAAIEFLPRFPLLADTVSLLLRWDEPDVSLTADLIELGGHPNPDVRAMVAEALAEISATTPDIVARIVRELIATPGVEGRERQRTGLRAAYLVTAANPKLDLSDVFVGIARGGDESLRREALDTLYLTWERHPEFVYELMTRMANEIEVIKPRVAKRLVEFLGSLSITLYTMHPGWDVGKPTSDLWYRVAQRLQLFKAASPLMAPVRALVFAAGNRQFSERILEGFLVSDPQAIERMFRLGAAEKEPFVRAIGLLDPATELDADARGLLDLLLRSDEDTFKLLAAQTIAVHALANHEATAPVVGELWEHQELPGRLWLLTAFSVLLNTTPAEWVDLLEDLTRRTAAASPEVLDSVEAGYLGTVGLDQLLFPLGFAYGKRQTDMPVLAGFLAASLEHDKPEQAKRCVRALGEVGFHHPRPPLQQLAAQWDGIVGFSQDDDSFEEELIRALATIRVLHLDEIDNFVLDMDASADLRARVRAGVDPVPLYKRVKLLGLYNNGVHQAVCFPKMRNGILQPIYRLLAESRDLRGAVNELTRLAWDMLVKAQFKLENWAEPATGGGPCR